MIVRHRLLLLVPLMMLLALAGCGVKGSLYRPDALPVSRGEPAPSAEEQQKQKAADAWLSRRRGGPLRRPSEPDYLPGM